ncbi:hypothetical protein [Silvimonas sp.]|uniref:phage tail tape measure protein n=1 Tax=Silvimonas sp. TaxID=2650811 RepID=UPI0028447F5E|nr:hypothetical protein [Silvimonas sp.]MDR3429010.1 hypothetical protein [Silvimonas sp.]
MSASNTLKLEVLFAGIDRLTGPLRQMMAGSKGMASAIKANRDQLKQLNQTARQVEGLRRLQAQSAETSNKMKVAQASAKMLGQQIAGMENPSKSLVAQFKQAEKSVAELTKRHQGERQELLQLRSAISSSGIKDLTSTETQLKQKIEAATSALKQQESRLEHMGQASRTLAKSQALAGNMAMAGYAGRATGQHVLGAMHPMLEESKGFQTEAARIRALGLGDGMSADAIKYATAMKTYGTSTRDNLVLMRDAMTVFADSHHAEMVAPTLAKMKFANQAMFGAEGGEEHDKKFMDMLKVIEMRGGLASEKAFKDQANIVQKVLTATGGRVGPEEWLNLIKTGGLAAKGQADESFYYKLEPLVQEMGGNRVGTAMMSAYQGMYQGKTTKRAMTNIDKLGLIEDRSKVHNDKAGQVSFMDPGALKGADMFRKDQFGWMEKVLLPTLAAKGITSDKQILDTIGSIFSNRTASNLFSQMYLQRNQIHKNAKLNEGADGIDKLNDKAKETAEGKEIELAARRADVYLKLGQTIMPAYTRALEMAGSAMQTLGGFAEKHQTLVKALMVLGGTFGVLLVAFGSVAVAIAGFVGPFAMLRYGFTMMPDTISTVGKALSLFKSGIVGTFRAIGTGISFLAANPMMLAVIAIIASLAVIAYVIYKHWEPIKGFFVGLWSQVKAAFAGGFTGVAALLLNWSPLGLFYKAFAGVLSWFGIELPGKFTEFGAMILRGLAKGITGALSYVKDAVTGAGDATIGWFKEKLGIHSPSRVFAELGGFTMAGLDQGLTRGQQGPLASMSKLAGKLVAAGAGFMIGSTGAAADVRIDSRPPLSASAQGGAPVIRFGSVIIQVTPTQGMDEAALARMVRQEIETLARQSASRARSRLSDSGVD